jgi:hypothetical protein
VNAPSVERVGPHQDRNDRAGDTDSTVNAAFQLAKLLTHNSLDLYV